MVDIDSISDLLCNIKEAMKPYFNTKTEITDMMEDKADKDHNHNTLYYDKSTMDTKLLQKANTDHDHDTRYYTKALVDSALEDKADVQHTHPIDSSLIADSDRPVKNSVITSALNNKANLQHDHNSASATAAGFMSKEMFNKLNEIEPQANKTVVDSALNSASTNPVQNKVINAELNKKAGLDVVTKESKGLMSSAMYNKLDGIYPGARAKKKTLGWLITSPSDTSNQGLITINRNANLTMKLYDSDDGTLEQGGIRPVPNLGIHYSINGTNLTKNTGEDGNQGIKKIEVPAGDYIMHFVFHGTGNYYPAYRTILLRVQ